MKERPILFSAPMVRALLAGTKTQTRRIMKDRYLLGGPPEGCLLSGCPYGQAGDRLWVRETWMPCDTSPGGDVAVLYKASNDIRPDGVSCETFGASKWFFRGNEEVENFRIDIDYMDVYGERWRPSIFMRRWMSRITLEITGIRVERLQDISDKDAVAEGISRRAEEDTPFRAYRDLWSSINGPESWDANPWVWVIEFKRILP